MAETKLKDAAEAYLKALDLEERVRKEKSAAMNIIRGETESYIYIPCDDGRGLLVDDGKGMEVRWEL